MPVLDLFRLDGRRALVTGARRGIGRAFADALAEAGAEVVGTSVHWRDGETPYPGYACDLGDRAAVDRLISDVGPVDILVNNGGTILRKPAAEHPDDYWDRVIEVNLTAQFRLARAFGQGMLERGAGKVIFTASVLSFQGGITVPGYAASKGGVASLVKALANEWAARGVQVNAIAPGYIETDNTEALRHDPERSKAILGRIPAARWGHPDDLKGAVVYLASRASDYVSGTLLTVDGGWLGR